MFLCVSGCDYLENGAKRIYHLNDHSTVTEHPSLPGKSRWQYYDRHNHTIHTPSTRAAMKKAVERHKKKWRTA